MGNSITFFYLFVKRKTKGDVFLQEIIQYFEEGIKSKMEPFRLGLELEHFIVDKKEFHSLDYLHGIEEILKKLRPLYDEAFYSEGHLISLKREDLLITIEPAGQFEISLAPKENLSDIFRIYKHFMYELEPVLEQHNACMIHLGYQPRSKVENLKKIPKKRYQFMESYFQEIGPYGSYMMKGTAAAHVSIDYTSESDFSKKYRIAYALSPLFSLFMENTPYFEGEPYHGHLLRGQIWDKTDCERVSIEKYMQDGEMTFASYADFVTNEPLILDISSGKDQFTVQSAAEIYANKSLTKRDIEHILSMVFPDIRLKQYIEIRCADSNSIEYVMPYLEMLRNIFGTEESVDWWYQLVRKIPIEQVSQTKHEIIRLGRKAMIYGRTADEWICRMQTGGTDRWI